MKVRNTFVIFVVSGFWHGANWTFIAWGLLNAIYIMPSIIFNTNRNNLDIVAKGKLLPSPRELLSMAITFSLTMFAWIFFRSINLKAAFVYITHLFSSSIFSAPYFPGIEYSMPILSLILLFLLAEWIGREYQYAFQAIYKIKKTPVRLLCYYVVIAAILLYGNFGHNEFIYFQF